MNPLTRKAIYVFVFVGIGVPIFAKLVIPWFIVQAYQRKSLGFLNAVITGQANHPVSFYLNEWAKIFWPIMWTYIIMGLLAVFLYDMMNRPTVYIRFSGQVRDLMARGRSALKVLITLAAMMVSGSVTPALTQVVVTVSEKPVGAITLGTGWNTWEHWWQEYIPRYQLTWNDAQWTSYLNLLEESGSDWMRLDYNYAETEPRNDNADPTLINWAAYTFNSEGLKSLYRMLDFCQAHGINVYLTHTYLRSNHVYNADRLTGWLSKEAVSRGFPTLWTRPKDEPVDRRELAENLAATTYFLIKERKYTVIKQVALYVEPDLQWINVDGFQDTLFLGELLTKLGIREDVAILAPHTGTYFPPSQGDYNIYAIEDYAAIVNWKAPEQGLQNVSPQYQSLPTRLWSNNPSREVAVMEYGNMWNEGATGPLPSYLSTLSGACLIFTLYNTGFAGSQRWAFSPLYHPFQGFGVITVDGVSFPFPATEPNKENVASVITAMSQGATFLKVPQTFEPQRLVNINLQRGSRVYQTTVHDLRLPGKGLCVTAVKNQQGEWKVGLINLYPYAVDVELAFQESRGPKQFLWEYYDDSLPPGTLHGGAVEVLRGIAALKLSPRSLNFLVE